MAKTYELCGDDVDELVTAMMRTHHSDLEAAEVTVQAVFIADTDENDEPVQALKVHGVWAAAKVQVTSLADRARGIADAKLTIDQYTWDRLNGASRLALIDHELEHLTLVVDKEGELKLDDLQRPRLKLRVHDWSLAGFQSIANRHGEAAIEVQELRRFRCEQLPLFPEGVAAAL